MSRSFYSRMRLSSLPVISIALAEWRVWRTEQAQPCYQVADLADNILGLPAYPIDMFPLLALPFGALDDQGVPYNDPTRLYADTYHPTTIAQYALACWNAYLSGREEEHRQAFLIQAHWLLDHETRLTNDTSGWPLPFPLPDYFAPTNWLSALTQGNAVSVLVRAYRLTGDERFLESAHRAVRTFELDILDGGVSSALGEDGIFFEDVAVYPAAHILNGFVLAVFGLYDYVELTNDTNTAALIERSLATLHTLLDEFDTGYWTSYDLMHRSLAPRFCHALHVTLLETLARISGCEHCAALAARWAAYQQSFGSRLRYFVISHLARYHRAFSRMVRSRLFPLSDSMGKLDTPRQTFVDRVCVPIMTFPVAGGMRGVLSEVAQVMAKEWCLEYLVGRQGMQTDGLIIRSFGSKIASCWHFPSVWFYSLRGWCKLILLIYQGSAYRLILPQDGLYTGAFAALAGKMMGQRVVCMDHGSVTLPYSGTYGQEWLRAVGVRGGIREIFARLELFCYVLSLRMLARIAAHYTDLFLVAGDEVEKVYRQRLDIHPSRIIRYPYVVNVNRFTPLTTTEKICHRAQEGIAADAIVVTMINRFSPEKGMDIALQGIKQALASLSSDLGTKVKYVIAGTGSLRTEIETQISRSGLSSHCILWGEAAPKDVEKLLAISDIFLYTGTRGTNYSMAVLEAMASGCAVIASTEPRSNAILLAEERGIAIPAGDSTAVSNALIQAIGDEDLRLRMGHLARAYVSVHHSTAELRRCLHRAGFWPLAISNKSLDYAAETFSGCLEERGR